ncbi:hypothetical protein GOC40_24685 [Sinorhizobium meliloti]|nr:hypothetical protein [Sinorhizobium meliloti]
MSDRISVVFKVDPVTRTVSRDGMQVDLAPTTAVDAGDGQMRTLADILDAYAKASDFEDVRRTMTPDVQQAVGVVLYRALGPETFSDERCRWVEISVDAPGDAAARGRFVQSLPWPLTAQPDPFSFLAQRGAQPWLFTLDGAKDTLKSDVLFPPEPRILLMITHSQGEILGREHQAEIEAMLRPNYSAQSYASNVRVARRWSEAFALLSAAEVFDPHIIYFYGHGQSETGVAELIFDLADNELPEVSASTIATVLASLESLRRPALFFANCCSGANAVKSGIGDAIGGHVGCVVSNRTVVDLHAARVFGLEVLNALVSERRAPDTFMADVTLNVIMKVSGSHLAGRWACPVVHTNYGQWIGLAPQAFSQLHRATAGRVVNQLDRKAPVDLATSALGSLIREPGYHLRSLVWQAEGDQGVTDLGVRLRDEFLSQFTRVPIREFMVELQADTRPAADQSARRHIFASIYSALGRPGESPFVSGENPRMLDVLKRLSRHLSKKDLVLLVQMVPVAVDDESGQRLIQSYWQVWIDLLGELTRNGRGEEALRIVVTIALQISNAVVDVQKLLPAPTDQSAQIVVFDRLGSVTTDDIKEHITTFASVYEDIAGNQIAEKAQEIHRSTAGVYMPTVQLLKRIAGYT